MHKLHLAQPIAPNNRPKQYGALALRRRPRY
jgi:hypothetical protein